MVDFKEVNFEIKLNLERSQRYELKLLVEVFIVAKFRHGDLLILRWDFCQFVGF